jgi:ribosomal protein L37E
MTTAPDYRLHCKRCGGRFVEMVDLLFHRCGQPAKRPAKVPWKRRKNRAGASHA